jgi:hypothetical protein
MKEYFLFACVMFLMVARQPFSFAGDSKKAAPVAAPKDMKEETLQKDSIAYSNLETSSGTYEYQTDTNSILLPNGLKISFNRVARLRVPRGITLSLPDPFSNKMDYELGELEISATNTGSAEIKLDGSEPVFVSLKLYSSDNGHRSYASQYSLSSGSVYGKMEPAQMEKQNAIYIATNDFLNKSYKAGQTKTFTGIIVPVPKSVRKFDHLVLYTREFGQNRSYGCPAHL